MEAVNNEGPCEGRQAWFSKSNVRHPMLLAMPYPANAATFLHTLQDHLTVAMAVSNALSERLSALDDIFNLVRERWSSGAEANSLLTAIVELVEKTLCTARLDELRLGLIFDDDSIEISNVARGGSGSCALFLRKGEPLPAGTRVNSTAVSLLGSLVNRLEGKSEAEIVALGPEECMACMRMLFLYAQYSWVTYKGENRSSRAKAFLNSTGRSIWKALLDGVTREHRNSARGFDEMYGLSAYNQVMHRLCAGEDPPPGMDSDSESKSSNPISSVTKADYLGLDNRTYHVVAVEPFTPAAESEARQTLKQFALLLDPLPVAHLPPVANIDTICAKLIDEFPWAAEAINSIFNDLRTRRLFGSVELGFTPILLLGPPGVGKTRLVRRIAEELVIPYLAISIAGMDDSRIFTGTSRGWSSGQPSPILEFLLRHRSASGLLLLDEIDKATSRSANSVPATVVLLALLEPENARCWFDTFLQSRFDLTRLLYIGTANTVDGVPGPLLSRMSVQVIRRPNAEQLVKAVTPIIADLTKEWALPPGVLPHVYPNQLAGSAQNVRQLRALVRSYMHSWAKDNLGERHIH